MADTQTLPSTTNVPITIDSLLLPNTGPIEEILYPITTFVEVGFESSRVASVLGVEEFELVVAANDKKSVVAVLRQVIGGKAFDYALNMREGFEGCFELKIFSKIGEVSPKSIARMLQSINDRVTFYFEGNIVPAH